MATKRITLRKLFLRYPYKYYDMFSSTVPDPYFPTSEISEHEYRLECKQWMMLAKIYFDEVEKLLLNGEVFDMGRLGKLVLLRKKQVGLNIKKTIESKQNDNELVKYYYPNNHTNGYKPYIKWMRTKKAGCGLPYKSFYSFNFIRNTTWKRISNELHKNPHIINKLRDYHEWIHSFKDSSKSSSEINT